MDRRDRAALLLLDETLIAATLARARQAPRRRVCHNFHADAAANPQRFLNVMLRGTYVVPHRHRQVPKSESFLVLRGRAAFLLFDDRGSVCRALTLGPDHRRSEALGVDLEPGLWHTLLVLSRQVVCFEVKPGPYDPVTDKEFATWAPAEGSAEAPRYLSWLLAEHQRLARTG